MTAQPSESISLRRVGSNAYMQWQSSYGAMSSEEDSHDAAKLLNDGGPVEGMDAIITEIGEFGKFQKIVYGSLTYSWVPIATMMSYVFISPEKVAWQCMSAAHPLCNNTDVQFDEGARCKMTQGIDWRFVDKNQTVTAEFDLICEDSWKAPFLGSIFFCGYGFGAYVGGYLAGPYGRKRVYLVAMWMSLASTIFGTFASSFNGYAAARFFQGVFLGMFGLTMFVLSNEFVGKSWVGTTGALSQVTFPVGELILAGFAYEVPGWRAQTLATCVLFLPCLIMPFFLLPESARWLLSQGRDEEAMVLLRLVAKTNGTTFPSDATLKPPTTICVQAIVDDDGAVEERSSDQASLKLLMTHPELRKRQVAMVVAWITCALLYFGLTSAGSALTDNRYADFCWQALAEFPGVILAWIGLNNHRTGRKGTMVLSFAIGGFACFLMMFLQHFPAGLRTVLAMIGKTAITCAFSIVFVWSLELFPTSLRSGAMGIQSFSSNVGAIIAPLVLLMGQPPSPIPYIVFTILAIFATILTSRLPETRGKPMPNSLSEISSDY